MKLDSIKPHIEYKDINFNNENDLKLLKRFYNELYIEGFSDKNERESLENMIKQAKRLSENSSYHCVLAICENEIIGGIIGDYLKDCNCGILEFLIVSPLKRKEKLGINLTYNIIELINKDAMRLNNKPSMKYCFFETENPNKISDKQIIDNCHDRFKFLNKLFIKILDIDYIQPPLEDTKNAIDYLYLGIIPFKNNNVDNINKEDLLGFLKEYFKFAIGINNIENCKEYNLIKNSISNNKIKLHKIDELLNNKMI